jgi:hypothetical protein
VADNTINEDLQEDNKNEEESPIRIDAEGYLVNIETRTRIRNISFDTPISDVRLLLRTVKYSPRPQRVAFHVRRLDHLYPWTAVRVETAV